MVKLKILLSATVLSASPLPFAGFQAQAQVVGVAGCVMSTGYETSFTLGNGGGAGGGGGGLGAEAGMVYFPIGGNVGITNPNCGEAIIIPGQPQPWLQGNFADTGSVNSAISALQGQIDSLAGGGATGVTTDGTTIVGDGTAPNPIRLADGITNTINGTAAQANQNAANITNVDNRVTGIDGRVTVNEAAIASINTVNDRQDATLNDHEQRITQNEGDIAGIQDGAVFYNRDETGQKTGGVTLNDGTGTPVALGNVAAGALATDAVNVSQLTASLDGLGGGASVGPDGVVTGPTYNIGGATYFNVGDALNATNQLSVQYVPDADGNPTNTVALIGDGTGQPVKITNVAAGTDDTDGVNYGQVKNNISYDTNADGTRSNTVSLVGGAAGPVLINNVADGIANNDAANIGQVRQARAEANQYTDDRVGELRDYTDGRLGNLSGEIRDVQREARSGIATATAMAGLRYDDRPGKGSIAAGLGGFKSATSMAAGVGYTTEDGRFRLNGSLGYGFEDASVSWNTGASWTFN